MNSRLGFFFCSNFDGNNEKSILFLVKSVSQYLDHCIAVTNCEFKNDVGGLADACDEIIYGESREKTIAVNLLQYIENGLIESYDEIVLFDDSVFGPFTSMESVFYEMSLKDSDFWGLYRQASYIDKEEVVDSCLSPFFFVIKKSLYNNTKFKKFLELILIEELSVNKWTVSFEKMGFVSSAYYDLQDYVYPNPEQNYNILKYRTYELVTKVKFPFLEKSRFSDDNAWNSDLFNTLEYLNEQTEYDVNIIWQSILQTCDINQIRKSAQLIYILPDNISKKQFPDNKKIAVIAHFYYLDCLVAAEDYLSQIPHGVDLYITTSSADVAERAKELEGKLSNLLQIRMVKNRGRDVSALLVGCRNLINEYDYLCFVHDKKTSSIQSATVWELFSFNMWENNLKSEDYIYNIIELFEKNTRLGLLVPPIPKHANYINLLVDGWRQCYEGVKALLNELKVDVPISYENQPFAFSTTFWCRTEALKILFNRDYGYEDFHEEPLPATGTISHAIERSLPYIAQAAGYVSGTIESASYAQMELASYEVLASNMISESENLKCYNAELKEELDVFGERNKDLREELDVFGKRNKDLREELSVFGERDKELRKELDALGKRNKELKIKVDEFGEYNKKLKEKLKKYN